MKTRLNESKFSITTFGGLSRSALMSKVRSTGNATTELKLMSLLRKAGVTGWRRNYPLAGKPDFVFPKCRLVVFVDGCFWHGHNCRNLSAKQNAKFWRRKIAATKLRDKRNSRRLRAAGWNVIRIWECGLEKRSAACMARIQNFVAKSLGI
ncbi:MAG TPA: very short patch repair endonuclease [Verrucomicrobiae bacterium]|nr:very short patch repair endonuclease [Verrucomicrobiae bacterium]